MREEQLRKSLNELAQATAEPVRSDLADDIKQRIPHRFMPRRGSRNAINIIIRLKVSKLTAAAVIIMTIILLANLLSRGDLTSDDIYQEGKILLKSYLGGERAAQSDKLAAMSKFYEHLIYEGKDAVYYGDSIDPDDNDAVLIQWKLSEGQYRVIFGGDLRVETVSAEELIKLQSQMLQKKTK